MPRKPHMEDSPSFWSKYDQHYTRVGNVCPGAAAQPIKAEWLPQDKEAVVLDIGCGWGNLLLSLWATGYRNLYGVEISRPMYDIAIKSVPEEIKLAYADSIDYL